jgi:hypothetical protein
LLQVGQVILDLLPERLVVLALLQQEVHVLVLVESVDQGLLGVVLDIVDQKSDDRFGHQVVDVLLDHIEVRGNQVLYQFDLGVLPALEFAAEFDL